MKEEASEIKIRQLYLHNIPGLDVSLFLSSPVKKFYSKLHNDFLKAFLC